MNEIFNQMMALHKREGSDGERNALYEVTQQVVLSGLYRGGFFNEAAFYGGTCLEYFMDLNVILKTWISHCLPRILILI